MQYSLGIERFVPGISPDDATPALHETKVNIVKGKLNVHGGIYSTHFFSTSTLLQLGERFPCMGQNEKAFTEEIINSKKCTRAL